jgi:hypothetical protein
LKKSIFILVFFIVSHTLQAQKPVANQAAIVLEGYARFTILSPQLI